MKIRELRGLKSFKAFQAFHRLMLGLKMLPMYMGEAYDEFYARVELMEAHDKENMIRQAALFVDLDDLEIQAILCFCLDQNGVPYSTENMGNLKIDEIYNSIVAVCFEISKIQITMVTEAEKKN